MKLINELKKRSDNIPEEDDIKIDLKLYNLAHDIAEKIKPHLKRIIAILPEFDIHDEKHSEKVVMNMEELLREKIQELSSYEIFLLYLSAFLHDSAMAPSDYEINVMKLTEGSELFFENVHSIKNDTKPPLKFSEAINLITKQKKEIYKVFDFYDKWIFCHETEDDFIKYLAELLVDYQDFRNGFSKDLKKIDSQEKFTELNNFIRIDYIRSTHHIRSEKYVKNLEREFGKKLGQSAWGKKLAHDLAKICRAHGENVKFIENFEKNTRYYGTSTTNLQMVAMILRLSDIIHYSFDRAPISLLSSKVFKSEYSFHEWMVKQSGANYIIENGLISYSAYCDNPNEYFKLHRYIDWIDNEIQNYFKLQRTWSQEYIKNLVEKVNRENLDNDKSKFLPKRGIGFTLNQRKILELLKGVGLYKDEYACLRELYQNSLDACRCMIAKNSTDTIQTNGKIEFGIDENDSGIYLYCLDNGIGMTKEILENYLLHIGNSYYNSFDFYKEQAKWGGDFTPTSQFGIGILSCFMIANKIEITSKADVNFISCIIDGIDDSFYYKTPESIDREKIAHTGTLIKIYLNPNISNKIEYSNINKLGIAMVARFYEDEFEEYQNDFRIWNNHIGRHIINFIHDTPENINVKIKLKNEKYLPIISKPIYVLEYKEQLNIDLKKDENILNNLISHDENDIVECIPKIEDIDKNISLYKIDISEQNIKFSDLFFLPNKDFNFKFDGWMLHNFIFNSNRSIAIDGIVVESSNLFLNHHDENYFLAFLAEIGFLNFTGQLRPSISIDRKNVIMYPEECNKIARVIIENYFDKIIHIAINHIISQGFLTDLTKLEDLFSEIMFKLQMKYGENLFIEKLCESKIGDSNITGLSEITETKISIKDFLNLEKVYLKNLNYHTCNYFLKNLINRRLKVASSIFIKDNIIKIETEEKKIHELENTLEQEFEFYEYIFEADIWEPFNPEFDIITSLFPLVPSKLFNELEFELLKVPAKTKKIPSKHSTISDLFFQSPFAIHSQLGIYGNEIDEENRIYNFDQKRGNLYFHEIRGNIHSKNIVITAFISPEKLNKKDDILLENYNTLDPNYVKGVKEGWSILFTSMEIQNYVILPGKATRKELVDSLTSEFWEEYSQKEFIFLDGSIMHK